MSMEGGGPRSIELKTTFKVNFFDVSLPFYHLIRRISAFYQTKNISVDHSVRRSIDSFATYINENISKEKLEKAEPKAMQLFNDNVKEISKNMKKLLYTFYNTPNQDVISISQKAYENLDELKKAYTELVEPKA
jgi:hypothetical protein